MIICEAGLFRCLLIHQNLGCPITMEGWIFDGNSSRLVENFKTQRSPVAFARRLNIHFQPYFSVSTGISEEDTDHPGSVYFRHVMRHEMTGFCCSYLHCYSGTCDYMNRTIVWYVACRFFKETVYALLTPQNQNKR